MNNIDGFYVGEKTTFVGEIIQELKNFDQSYLPTVLNGCIYPIHHLECKDEGFGEIVYFVINDEERDVYINSVSELVMELNKFNECSLVMFKGNGFLTSSIDAVIDYIFDMDCSGNENFIPFNVSFLTTTHNYFY